MREIKLTQGKIVLVDDEDFDLLNQWKWYFSRTGKNAGYAKRYVEGGRKSRKAIYMHRFLMGIENDLKIDHKDRNRLNNQKSNLRVCSARENTFNKNKISKPTSSKYIGVSWHKALQKWRAYISANKKQVHIGYFDSLVQAVLMRNKKAIEMHGEFASINTL